MKTTFREEDNNFVMEFEGRLDTVASLKTAEEMKVLYNSKGHDIILDLSKLEYISSSGLRLFLNLVKETRPNGSHIFVTGASEHIRQVFAMTGFMRIFEFK